MWRRPYDEEIRWTYENVVPSENSAIVADAGRVSFATEAFLDQRRSVGFAAEDGHTYCVSPVASRVSRTAEVNFWAVGVDCCSLQGHFECSLQAQRAGSGALVRLTDLTIGNPRFRPYAALLVRALVRLTDLTIGNPRSVGATYRPDNWKSEVACYGSWWQRSAG
ncbi:hypothetical protein AK812_SmicGene1267 [Symbiodinium microadriaticum]|uniref:Uncharacterized protein n=1 Tax=Symbiodinium microadriaticum TaxID=2951 RepID=A0A1Q9F4M7_SYMMI|nr:hypothetical protein AK812_SmicGene1267 [Symbiodinium microadriaticum]